MSSQRRHQGNKKRRAQQAPKTPSKAPDTKELAWSLVQRGLCTKQILADQLVDADETFTSRGTR